MIFNRYRYYYLAIAIIETWLFLTCTPGWAEESGQSEKLRVLYSNQFTFDRRGVPLITVRIAENLNEVIIESRTNLRVLPDGEDGSEISGGKRWKVTLQQAKPGKLEHFAVLAREPVSALSQIRQEMNSWQHRGLNPRLIEIGTIFGVKGNIYDNRAYVLADGPFSRRQDAVGVAEKYAKSYGLAKIAILPQLKRMPSGLFEAVDLDTSAKVKTRDALWFAPVSDERLTIRVGPGKPRSYWGQIYLTLDSNGKMVVVNALSADRLLAGLVPAEIFPNAPMEALKAQAIAARGELLAKIGTSHMADPYLLCSTQHCQVYAGAGQEHPRTTEAVNATRGMVLLRKDGRLVDTVYSASCGGFTEHNDNTWPVKADDTLRGHLDADPDNPFLQAFRKGINEKNFMSWLNAPLKTWCGQTRLNQNKYRWKEVIPAAKMDEFVKPFGIGHLRGIRIIKRGISGRVNSLELQGTQGKRQIRGELDIRQLFGGLKSSMFMVEIRPGSHGRPQEFIFRGGGWGHGVGMCQTGAIGMAEAGKKYQTILRHYYPHSEIKALY